MAETLSGDIEADTLLQINQQKDVISQQANAAFAKIPNATASAAAQKQFADDQSEFSSDIIEAFTASLHTIFMVGSGLMAVGLVVVMFIENKKLRDGVKATPGE